MEPNTALGFFFGALTGLLVGLIPLVAGVKRDRPGLAIAGFASCITLGSILGIFLSIPCAALFWWAIRRQVVSANSRAELLPKAGLNGEKCFAKPHRMKEAMSVSLGGYSVGIPEATGCENGYMSLHHAIKYTIRITNSHLSKCDAEVFIDGQSVGAWRLNPRSFILLERPTHDSGRFTFYRLGSPEADKACILKDEQAGLVTVVFKPERFSGESGVRYQSFGPDRAGGTGLSGMSDQIFIPVAPIEHDLNKMITIYVRLIAAEDAPRPLSPKSSPVPPSLI